MDVRQLIDILNDADINADDARRRIRELTGILFTRRTILKARQGKVPAMDRIRAAVKVEERGERTD